jgi:hypothetical protein
MSCILFDNEWRLTLFGYVKDEIDGRTFADAGTEGPFCGIDESTKIFFAERPCIELVAVFWLGYGRRKGSV